MIFVCLIFASKFEYRQYFFKASTFCCNPCRGRNKIAKSCLKSNELTSVVLSVGFSLFVEVTYADGKSFINRFKKIVPAMSLCLSLTVTLDGFVT